MGKLVEKVADHVLCEGRSVRPNVSRMSVAGVDFDVQHFESISEATAWRDPPTFYRLTADGWYAHWRSDRAIQWGGDRDKMLRDLTICRLSGEVEE